MQFVDNADHFQACLASCPILSRQWARECQRRGGTTQLFHLLSFSGRWDPSFFATAPVPTEEPSEAQRRATCAASQARAKVRLARKYDHLKTKKWLYPDQLELVSKLHDGTLEEEAARLTKASGHFQRTLADNSSDVLQLAVGRPNEPLRINAATFFSSLTLVPMNMSNVVRLAEKRTDTQIVARHDCWVSLPLLISSQHPDPSLTPALY